MGKFEVRIDAISHLIPKKEGKKEWYIISCSKFDERENFVGWEHLDPVFLTPEQYGKNEDNIEIGLIVNAVLEMRLFNGKVTYNIIGFESR